MQKRTKALSIPIEVKKAVAERDSFYDHPCCIYCGKPAPTDDRLAFSCAHYIPRSLGGLGIEENTATLCPQCHKLFDYGCAEIRREIGQYLREYLMDCYPGWDESKLVYRKE